MNLIRARAKKAEYSLTAPTATPVWVNLGTLARDGIELPTIEPLTEEIGAGVPAAAAFRVTALIRSLNPADAAVTAMETAATTLAGVWFRFTTIDGATVIYGGTDGVLVGQAIVDPVRDGFAHFRVGFGAVGAETADLYAVTP